MSNDMTRKIPPMDSENEIRTQVNREVVRNGFIWALISVLTIELAAVYYLHANDKPILNMDANMLAMGVISPLFGLVLSALCKKENLNCICPYFGAFLVNVGFVVIAALVAMRFTDTNAAEKILVISFLISMMGWHVKPTLVAFSLIPTTLAYAYMSYATPPNDSFDQILTLIKFPILLFAYVFTARKFFVYAEKRFIEKIKEVQKLEKRSSIDELTQVYNRRGFNKGLKTAINHAARFEVPLSLVVIDIDFFKQYNDTLGHPAGDWCLKKVAAILKSECKRSVDIVGRMGGEEFAVVLPGATASQAQGIMTRIDMVVASHGIHHPGSSVSHRLTASVGIAELRKGESSDELYERADRAMYEAKTGGRNQIVLSEHDG